MEQKFGPEHWRAETKLAVLNECADLNGAELFHYCRRMSLTVEQVRQWQADCLTGLEGKAGSRSARGRRNPYASARRGSNPPMKSTAAIRERLVSAWS